MLKLEKNKTRANSWYLGQSGRATGPHLDIRLNWFDVKLDPMSVLNK